MKTQIFDPILQSAQGISCLSSFRGGARILPVFGMPETAKTPLLYGIAQEHRGPMLLVCANDFAAQKLHAALAPLMETYFLPTRLASFSRAIDNRDQRKMRIQALTALAKGNPCVVVGGVEAVLATLLPQKEFVKAIQLLVPGIKISFDELVQTLTAGGYVRVDVVQGLGEFSIRGDIVDLYAPHGAVRLDFFFDELNSIRELDTISQRSVGEEMEEFLLTPCVEVPLAKNVREEVVFEAQKALTHTDSQRLRLRIEEAQQGICEKGEELCVYRWPEICAIDYLGTRGLLLLDDPEHLKETAVVAHAELKDRVSRVKDGVHPGLLAQLASTDRLEQAQCRMVIFRGAGRKQPGDLALEVRPMQPLMGRMDLFASELQGRHRAKYRTVLAVKNEKRAQALLRTLTEREVSAIYLPSLSREVQPGEIAVAICPLGAGFLYEPERYAVYAESEIFRTGNVPVQRRATVKEVEQFDLAPGDYAVHDVHGIGIYRGMESITVEGSPRDFLVLEYRGEDKLYVPADQLHRVQRYIGSQESAPRLSKMGGAEWERAKQKVRSGVKQLAFDLVAMYAHRQATKGYAFSEDTVWQQEFEAAFPFDETEGQEQSIEEIKRDMESPRIMDRLLCGDVGYGKTEVALRAAFKAVMDAKQVLFLVPTTILAQQHYETFCARCEGYPVRIAVLSRFKTKQEQSAILTAFSEGKIDILIGTHRLLSKDVRPRDLGLLIIDEEHRFGVGHKELIRNLKKSVDVLTLTATPIPRTLEMSLIGIRDMSVIHTPIGDRMPVTTYIQPYSDELLREAIMRELRRDGQIYVLYNDVQRMERMSEKLHELAPQARIGVAHGQMGEAELERVMMAFYGGEIDVLLCSTIVESGVDVPMANTMFILNADRLGLAQLYQLRGRVGRSARTAFCYLTTDPQRALSEVAQKRLEAIGEYTELGSGYKIAMRDLEIRGAGNLLGPEQHGHMASVGYDTYCRLLAEAIREIKGDAEPEIQEDVALDCSIKAFIPSQYISSTEQKVAAYRRIASIQGEEDVREAVKMLRDRYGPLPAEVENLLLAALVRAECKRAQIASATVKAGLCALYYSQYASPDVEHLLRVAQQTNARILKTEPISIQLRLNAQTAREALQQTVAFLKLLLGETPIIPQAPQKEQTPVAAPKKRNLARAPRPPL